MNTARQLLIIFMLCAASLRVLAQGVDQPGGYSNNNKSHVEGCYRAFYKPPVKLDSLVKPEGITVHRVWRVISLKNTANKNLFVGNSKNCNYTDFLDILKFGLGMRKLSAFRSDNFSNPAANKIPYKAVMKMLMIQDTVTESVFDADGNPTTNTRVLNEEIQSSNLSGYLVCEDWYMDAHWSRREKRIICICPVYFNEKLQKDVPLFYLYYNEYRDLFSSFRALDIGNGEYLSYDEVFLEKKFESVVVKTSNVFSRAFNDYTMDKSVKDEGDASMRQLLNEDADMFDH